MRAAAPALLTFLALLVAGCLAPAVPEPGPALAPAAALSAAEGGAFATLLCPFSPLPDPARPLERCNVRATVGNGPANEIDLAVDPADPQHYVVVGKGYAYTRIVGGAFMGQVITPYATTFDGGATWTEGFLQPMDDVLAELPLVGPVGTTAVSDSDPVVEFAPDGTLVAQTLRVNGIGRGLPMFQSLDGGITFEEVGSAYGGSTDKNWIAADHTNGIMYTATQHGNGIIGVTRSLDNGLTWSPAVKVCSCSFAGLDVGAGGEVFVIGVNHGAQQVMFTRSLDLGLTWSAPKPIGPHTGVDWNVGNTRLFRTPNIQQLAASKVDGGVFATWASEPVGSPEVGACVPDFTGVLLNPCPQVPTHDVWLVASQDAGVTWGQPVRINDDADLPVNFQFMPQVAVSPNGRDLHLAWMDQRHDPTGLTANVYYAHSPDAGATWDANLLVSDQPFLTTLSHHQSITNLAFVGDYIGLQATDDKAVIAFPDTRYGRADIFIATVV